MLTPSPLAKNNCSCFKGGRLLFVHGIPFYYIPWHFPILQSIYPASSLSREQVSDAKHLIEQFGFEPVHFLRTSANYPLSICMEECFRFGDTLLLFNTLPFPRLQLSAHEWAVREADIRQVYAVISRHPRARQWFQKHLPDLPLFLTEA